MLNIFVTLLITGTALWVYLDATKHKIGKIEGAGGAFNMSAGAWAIVVLMLWIVAFPAYLIKRGDLIVQGKERPVETPGRSSKAALLGIAGTFMVAGVVALFVVGDLPDCDRPEVVGLVERLINDAPLIKATGIQIKLATPGQKSYDAVAQRRMCRASVSTPAGQEVIQYSVEWNDRIHSNFWVQIVPASTTDITNHEPFSQDRQGLQPGSVPRSASPPPNGPVEFVARAMKRDSQYSWARFECLSFYVQNQAGHTDVAVHEKHEGGCPGDPVTAPLVDRFRLLFSTGELLRYDAARDEYSWYADLKEDAPSNRSNRVATPPAASAPVTWAPSFDCTRARTGPERLICSSKELSAADVRMVQAYNASIKTSVDKDALKNEQADWRNHVRDACSDSQCMLSAYQSRTAQLAR